MGDLKGRKAAIIVADEFEDLELLYPMHRLQEEGIQIVVVGLNEKSVKGKHEYSVTPDKTIDQVRAGEFDFLVVPGGKVARETATEQQNSRIRQGIRP